MNSVVFFKNKMACFVFKIIKWHISFLTKQNVLVLSEITRMFYYFTDKRNSVLFLLEQLNSFILNVFIKMHNVVFLEIKWQVLKKQINEIMFLLLKLNLKK